MPGWGDSPELPIIGKKNGQGLIFLAVSFEPVLPATGTSSQGTSRTSTARENSSARELVHILHKFVSRGPGRSPVGKSASTLTSSSRSATGSSLAAALSSAVGRLTCCDAISSPGGRRTRSVWSSCVGFRLSWPASARQLSDRLALGPQVVEFANPLAAFGHKPRFCESLPEKSPEIGDSWSQTEVLRTRNQVACKSGTSRQACELGFLYLYLF